MSRGEKGSGSITKLPNGSFLVKIPHGKTGSDTTRYITKRALTMTEAKKVRGELIRERDSGKIVAGPRMTFKKFAENYLFEGNDHLDPGTLDWYFRMLTKHVFPVFGKKALRDIRSTEVQELLTSLRRKYSANTVNAIRSAMSAVFTAAENHELVANNPIRRTKKSKKQDWDPTTVCLPWTEEEVTQVIAGLAGRELRAPIMLLLSTGLRIGELLGLQWSDIDFDCFTVSVERTISHQPLLLRDGSKLSGLRVGPPKTKSSRRVVQLPSPMIDILRLHETEQELRAVAAGEKWNNTGFVFTSQVGTAIDVSNFRYKYRKFLEAIDVRYIRFHDIRHTFATVLIERDSGRLPAVSRALGHSSVSITMDCYASTARVENQATTLMAEVIFPGVELVEPVRIPPGIETAPIPLTDVHWRHASS